MKNKIGRPSNFNPETILHICTQIAEGKPLTIVCKQGGMPSLSTVFKWLSENKDFSDMYARAHDLQADVMAAEIAELADEKPRTYVDNNGAIKIDPAWVNNQRNRIDARKWTASKLKPRKYGDSIKLDHDSESDISNLSEEQLDTRLSQLLDQAGYVHISSRELALQIPKKT